MSRKTSLSLTYINILYFAVKLTAVLAIALINLAWVFPAVAAAQKVQIKSLSGYQVEINFSYDATQNTPILSEQGREAKLVDNLKVNFYAPDGKMIASYDNIVDGIIQSKYFEFNYELETQQLQGKVDLGGKSGGEMYLKGDIEQGFSLIMIEPSGEERIIDQVK